MNDLRDTTAGDPSVELSQRGVFLLRDAVETRTLVRFRAAAERCFGAMEKEKTTEADERLRGRCGFNPFSHSVLAVALLDFGCDGWEELLAPLGVSRVAHVITDAMGAGWSCKREQSWVRKKFAPGAGVERGHHYQGWHQDGALGVRFPAEPGEAIPMTELLTCWIPLNACGVDSPGLEFIRCPQSGLLHFTELDDQALRQRFPAEAFWAPRLELGDAVIFRNGTLHRTYGHTAMRRDRLSVEYRVFPGAPHEG